MNVKNLPHPIFFRKRLTDEQLRELDRMCREAKEKKSTSPIRTAPKGKRRGD